MAVIDSQPGPQRRASESRADVLFFGGGAGGGKSRFLIQDAAKYYDKPAMSSILFRRTYDELRGEGSLWAESEQVFPFLGGIPTESRLHWKFEAGGGVKFSHLEHEKDKIKHQGKQYSFVGFDELTHFTEGQFWYLYSRLRSAAGIPTRLRATMNPDPDSFVLDMVKPYLDETGVPDQRLSGALRWFVRDGNRMIWFDRREDAPAHAQSFTFIASRLEDNKILMKGDPSYLTKLRALPLIEQARLLGGNWYLRASAGDYFQSAWFPRLPAGSIERTLRGYAAHPRYVAYWRAWDLAATAGIGDGKHRIVGAPREAIDMIRAEASDPDYTVSYLFGLLDDGRAVLLDCTRHRDTPGAVEWLVGRCCEEDPAGTVQVFWQDPAQAGVHQETILRRICKGRRVATSPSMRPELVAKIASREAFAGRLILPDGAPWIKDVMLELEGYPALDHDDTVSALGLGCAYWLERKGGKGRAHSIHEREQPPQTWLNRPLEQARGRSSLIDVRTTSRFREF